MSSVIDHLRALSRSQMPIYELSPLISLFWSGHTREEEAQHILSDLYRFSEAFSKKDIPATREVSLVSIDSLGYWITVVGLAGEKWKNIKNYFISEFAPSIIRLGAVDLPLDSKRNLEVAYRALVAMLVRLGAKGEDLIFQQIFAPVTSYGIGSTSSQKTKKPNQLGEEVIVFNLAKWSLEEMKRQQCDLTVVLGVELLKQYEQSCIEYVQKPREQAKLRNEVLLELMPNFLDEGSGAIVWDLILHLLRINHSPSNSEGISVVEMRVDVEEERLAHELLVRFYNSLLPDDSSSKSFSSASPLGSISSEAEKRTLTVDLRENEIFWTQLIFRGLSSGDPMIRKRVTYVVKRMWESEKEVRHKWWNNKSVANVASQPSLPSSSLMQRYLMLMDAIVDHDANIVVSMWSIFYELLDAACVDVREMEEGCECIHEGFVKALVKRCVYACDSKILKRWILYRLLFRPHPTLQRLLLDLHLFKDIVASFVDLLGERISKLEYNGVAHASFSKHGDFTPSLDTSTSPLPTSDHPVITLDSFKPFFRHYLPSHDRNQQSPSFRLTFIRSLISMLLQDSNMPAVSICAFMWYLATEKQEEKGIFDAQLVSLLSFSLSSTFSGYTPALAHIAFHTSLMALFNHTNLNEAALPEKILHLLSSLPEYFKNNPSIFDTLCSIGQALSEVPPSSCEGEKSNSNDSTLHVHSWLAQHFLSFIQSAFGPETHVTQVPRSSITLKSVEGMKSDLEQKMRLLVFMPAPFVSQVIEMLVRFVEARLDDQKIVSLVALATIAKIGKEELCVSWASFLSSHSKSLFHPEMIRQVTKNLLDDIDLKNEEGNEEANKCLALFEALSAAVSLLPIMQSAGIDVKPLEEAILKHQMRWSAGGRSEMDNLVLIGSYQASSLPTINHLDAHTIEKIVVNLLAYDWPHKPSFGLDGPSWKWFSSKFESNRWSALFSILSNINMKEFMDVNHDKLENMIEQMVERSGSVNTEDFPLAMRVLKILLSHLDDERVMVDENQLEGWIERMTAIMRQEKTFLSKQVYHFMSAILNPSLLSSVKYARVINSFIDQVMKWAESTVGIGNWMVRLFEDSILPTSSSSSSSSNNTLVDHTQRMRERMTLMERQILSFATFGPIRAPHIQAPNNMDLYEAGFTRPRLMTMDEVLEARYMEDGDLASSSTSANQNTESNVPKMMVGMDLDVAKVDGVNVKDEYLEDSMVRLSVVALFPLLLNSPQMCTKMIEYMFGYDEVSKEEGRVEDKGQRRVPAFFAEQCASFAIQWNRKDTYGHHLDYRRCQMLTFLSMSCERKILFSVLWPLLNMDHLSSIMELINISSSILVWRILDEGSEEEGEKLFSKLIEQLSVLRDSASSQANEDIIFMWLSLAGFALMNVKMEKHKGLSKQWQEAFLLLLPWVSYNTLYIRRTAQDVLLSIEARVSSEWMTYSLGVAEGWVTDLLSFIASFLASKPLAKANRRETFHAQFLDTFTLAPRGGRTIARLANLIFSLHPSQHLLSPSEIIQPNLVFTEIDRLAMRGEEASEPVLKIHSKVENESKVENSSNSKDESNSKGESISKAATVSSSTISLISSPILPSSAATMDQTTSMAMAAVFQRKIVPWQSISFEEFQKQSKLENWSLLSGGSTAVTGKKSNKVVPSDNGGKALRGNSPAINNRATTSGASNGNGSNGNGSNGNGSNGNGSNGNGSNGNGSTGNGSTSNGSNRTTSTAHALMNGSERGNQSFYSMPTVKKQDIIIVASLLKKATNLGGLTRTAEIFGASKLVIASKEVMKDKSFLDVAVSADQWLTIEEVDESNLAEYLTKMKRGEGAGRTMQSDDKLSPHASQVDPKACDVSTHASQVDAKACDASSDTSPFPPHGGYTLIGLEQTSSSLPLQHFQFPTKTILLLGDEKHGIPVHLLQLLDHCVEIPQLGIIRSLNVHVSASICIWEYTKQHL